MTLSACLGIPKGAAAENIQTGSEENQASLLENKIHPDGFCVTSERTID
jgi:hypothetical protein